MAWHDKVFEAFANFLKPKAEEKMEEVIGKILEVPVIRSLFEWNPDLMAAIISAAIGAIPEMDKRTILGKFQGFGIDMAETIPRETVRAIKGQGTTRKGIGAQLKVSGEAILNALNPKLKDKISDFYSWFFDKLSEDQQKKAERYILGLGPDRLLAFLELESGQRTRLVDYIKEPPPSPPKGPSAGEKFESFLDKWEDSQRRRGLK